jgi:SAM-dependent methyltransferase
MGESKETVEISVAEEGRGGTWAEVAYEAIAPVYDDFTAHHNYDLWLDALLPKVEAQGLRGNQLLDVACGTGKSFLPMRARGWEVTACDISARMVAAARSKVGPEVKLSVQDMRELPVLGSFDLVFCLDDAINYLLSQEELVQALTHIGANLAPHGLLLFDVNTVLTYRTFFAEHVEVESGARRMIWDGLGDGKAAPRSITESEFRVEPLGPEGGAPIEPERHRQRHFPEADVRAALDAAGLECLDLYAHTEEAIPEQPLDELRHTKAVYISRSKART